MEEILGNVFKVACDHLGVDAGSVNVEMHFTSPRAIKRLNALHRGQKKRTDVLAFPNIELRPGQIPTVGEFPLDVNPETGKLELGTIFICERVAKIQAKKLGSTLQREVSFLYLHGFLHLLGYTHDDADAEEKMCKLQQVIRSKYE